MRWESCPRHTQEWYLHPTIKDISALHLPQKKSAEHFDDGVWSVDRPYVNGLQQRRFYSDRPKLGRPVDRPTFFSRPIEHSTCLCVEKG